MLFSRGTKHGVIHGGYILSVLQGCLGVLGAECRLPAPSGCPAHTELGNEVRSMDSAPPWATCFKEPQGQRLTGQSGPLQVIMP